MKFSFVSSVFAAVLVLFSEELLAVAARDAYICLNDLADGLSLASDTRAIAFATAGS